MATNTKYVNFLQKVQLPGATTNAGRFFWHLMEMMAAMEVGGILFQLSIRLSPATSTFATVFGGGTFLYVFAITFFMTVSMVGWMIVRGHGWRHSTEMALAMIAPVALGAIPYLLGNEAYLPWLAALYCPMMCLGMIALMIYRREHFTGPAAHSTLASSSGEAPCH